MSEQPFNIGGIIKGGRVLVAPAGTEMVLTNGRWTDIGELTDLSAGNLHPTTITALKSIESMTFQELPPKTRREKRSRNAFMRILWGGPLPTSAHRRQLIHNGRKP